MKKEIMLLLILILTTTVTAQVPTYQLECVLPAPGCTSVDLSPDGTKLCARMQYGGWNEGYRVFDADTHDILNDCGGYSAPWRGLVSADSAYLYTTLYYRGVVAKIDLSTCAELPRIPVGPWPLGLAFDSQRRYLYVGVNCPGRGVIGSLKVIDTNTDQVVGSVPLNGEPGYMVLDSCDEFVYLVSRIRVPETLYKIRTSDYGVEATLAVPGVDEPCISVSPDCTTVYVPYPGADLVYKINTATLNDGGSWSIDSPHGFFVSPDGTHALITGHSDPNIRVFDLLTETVVQTIDVGDIGTSYSPSKSTTYWDKNDGKVYVNLCASEGGVAVLVPEPEPLTGRIAFIRYPQPWTGWPRGGRLWVMNADGTGQYEVPLPYEQYPQVESPEWSRSGERITFYANDAPTHAQVFVVNPDGSGFCRVTNGSGDLVTPSFSPDGSKIAFHQVYGHLYTIDAVCNAPSQTDHGINAGHTRWSPDGRYIAYTNWGFTYQSDIFLYDLTTGGSQQITHHAPGGAFNYAAWSPDGTKLAVGGVDPGSDTWDIWIMNRDGSDSCKLTADWSTSNEGWPSWSPDGQYIVFTSDISGNTDIWYTPVDYFDSINITNSPEDEVSPTITISEPAVIEVTIDIKPGSCPNPLNVRSRGMLPVAILGSEGFDVNSVDVASIRLASVAPIRSSYEDVAAPLPDRQDECECTTAGSDGYTDLALKFKTREIVEALGEVSDGDELVLNLTGVLYSGVPIEGADCIVVRGKFKPFNSADLNKDGVVDTVDFALLAENWLKSSVVED